MEQLMAAMIEYDKGDAMRIHHFLKVYELARTIGRLEGLDERTQYILESAAIVHDIGIHISEQKYGSSAGRYQEIEGPAEARRLLTPLGYDEEAIRRIEYLVGHHHTYTNIEGLDYQILVEADFLVNLYEDGAGEDAQCAAYCRIFRTEAGRRLCRLMYPATAQADA